MYSSSSNLFTFHPRKGTVVIKTCNAAHHHHRELSECRSRKPSPLLSSLSFSLFSIEEAVRVKAQVTDKLITRNLTTVTSGPLSSRILRFLAQPNTPTHHLCVTLEKPTAKSPDTLEKSCESEDKVATFLLMRLRPSLCSRFSHSPDNCRKRRQ